MKIIRTSPILRGSVNLPSKMLLQDLTRTVLASLQDLARSCRILQDFAGSCGILQEFCARFLKNPTISRKIPQDLVRMQNLVGIQEKRIFSCKILQERFYWVVVIKLKNTMAGRLYIKRRGMIFLKTNFNHRQMI